MVVAPVIAPFLSITIEGVLRKLVKPVLAAILIPLTVPLAPAERDNKLLVFPVLVAAFYVIDNPVAVLPAAAAELLVKEIFWAVPVVKDVSEKAIWFPVVPVEVTVRPVNVPTEVKEEVTTVELRVVPVRVPAAAVTVIATEPSKLVPL